MPRHEEIEERTEKLVMPFIKENRFELVDVEFVKEGGSRYLRLYIDKAGGITVDDCELISRALSDRLDEEDFIDESYILEVSSPGLGRPLKKPKDFERSIGEDVEIHLYRPVEGLKEYTGVLRTYDDATVTIETDDGGERTFNRSDLALIRLAFYF